MRFPRDFCVNPNPNIMKTYKLLCLLLVGVLFISCQKSDSGDDGGDTSGPGADADYTLLVNSANGLDGIAIDATADVMTFSAVDSQYSQTPIPTLSFKEGAIFSFYQPTGNCSATFLKFDFNTETSKSIAVFTDLGTCDLTALAVAHFDDIAYIAYGIAVDSSTTDFFVRAIDMNGTVDDFTDIPLNKRPVDLRLANNRLFVLTIDDQVTDENFLTVIDSQNNSVLIEIELGYDAQKLLRNVDDNIIVSYDELHTFLDSETLTKQFIQYQSGKEPEFVTSSVNNFDDLGNMYYEKPSGQFSTYPFIPAVFDFSKSLTTLYPFENFLTETERDFEFKIETTTMVGYDEKNEYMLIGYKKTGAADKGGLLRVRTGAPPAVIDNIDVDGIPFNIIVKQ